MGNVGLHNSGLMESFTDMIGSGSGILTVNQHKFSAALRDKFDLPMADYWCNIIVLKGFESMTRTGRLSNPPSPCRYQIQPSISTRHFKDFGLLYTQVEASSCRRAC